MIKLERIEYSELNSKQKEIYNFQKIAGALADYGFNCIKLADDWQGADFIAYHKDRADTLLVQLKSRLTIDKKYTNKNLYMAFPRSNNNNNDDWYLILHDELVEKVKNNTNWLNTESWLSSGLYHSANPNQQLLESLKENLIEH